MRGFIRAYGDKAIAIQTLSMRQYYAPFEHVAQNVKDLLTRPLHKQIYIDFKVDETKTAGRTVHGTRYYANSITLVEIII